MLKPLSLLIISSLIFTSSALVNANPAEKKLSLSIFSELKQKRSNFPAKSKFETNEEYLGKINAVSVSARPLRLELPLSSYNGGKYNLESQLLTLKLNTSSKSIDFSTLKDQQLTKKKLFKRKNIELLEYRRDSQIVSREILTCTNGYGARDRYSHETIKSMEYLINAINLDVDKEIILKMPPLEAKKYFESDETLLNGRLQVRLNLDPVAPYYSNYSSYSSIGCPKSILGKGFAKTAGLTTRYSNNHLIHADVSYLEIYDKVTGKTLYSISPNRETETKLSTNSN